MLMPVTKTRNWILVESLELVFLLLVLFCWIDRFFRIRWLPPRVSPRLSVMLILLMSRILSMCAETLVFFLMSPLLRPCLWTVSQRLQSPGPHSSFSYKAHWLHEGSVSWLHSMWTGCLGALSYVDQAAWSSLVLFSVMASSWHIEGLMRGCSVLTGRYVNEFKFDYSQWSKTRFNLPSSVRSAQFHLVFPYP